MEALRFLSEDQVRQIAIQHGTPVYVYSRERLEQAAKEALAFPNAYGLTVRYAMKANPHQAILRIFDKLGLHIDASSGYEAQRAMMAGIAPDKIMLTTQQLPENFMELVDQGVRFNACSIMQLERYGEKYPGSSVSIRVNPGLGSGSTNRTNVGGPGSSFGIWHEHLGLVRELTAKYNLTITQIHTHIGSGSDPAVWQKVAGMCLNIVKQFETVKTLSMGGGYKVGRMSDEKSTDLQVIGEPVKQAFVEFAKQTGREIKLEVEPGTYLVAMAGAIISRVQDVNSTGSDGYDFLKLDAGMTDLLRPALYGAQHPLVVVTQQNSADGDTVKEYVVVGHCCESGDIFTPAEDDPEGLSPRPLAQAHIGDYLVVEGAGGYVASMCAKNYNSFPEAAEVLVDLDGSIVPIRKRQTLVQMVQNEQMPKGL